MFPGSIEGDQLRVPLFGGISIGEFRRILHVFSTFLSITKEENGNFGSFRIFK